MGNFYRRPVIGADDNSWGPYVLQLMDDSKGANSCRLYNDSGDLKISAGKIGISDGTVIGICDVTEETIDISGISVGNWAKIEISVSGSAYTIAASDIAGATTGLIIPASVKAAYDDDKQGYYLTATKRLVGIAWKDAAGALSIIYNTENGIIGFKETDIITYFDNSSDFYDIYYRKIKMDIGPWNMDANNDIQISLNSIGATAAFYLREISIIIIKDDSLYNYNISQFNGLNRTIGINTINTSLNRFSILRETGGVFDSTDFNDAVMNRGYLILRFEV